MCPFEGDTEVTYLKAGSILFEFEPEVVERIRVCFIRWTQIQTVFFYNLYIERVCEANKKLFVFVLVGTLRVFLLGMLFIWVWIFYFLFFSLIVSSCF